MCFDQFFQQMGQGGGGPSLNQWQDPSMRLPPGQMAHPWERPSAMGANAPMPQPRPGGMLADAPMPRARPQMAPPTVSHNAVPAPADPRVTAAPTQAPQGAPNLDDILALHAGQSGVPLLDNLWRRRS